MHTYSIATFKTMWFIALTEFKRKSSKPPSENVPNYFPSQPSFYTCLTKSDKINVFMRNIWGSSSTCFILQRQEKYTNDTCLTPPLAWEIVSCILKAIHIFLFISGKLSYKLLWHGPDPSWNLLKAFDVVGVLWLKWILRLHGVVSAHCYTILREAKVLYQVFGNLSDTNVDCLKANIN